MGIDALLHVVLPLAALVFVLAASIVVVRSKQAVVRQQILSELVETLEHARAIDKEQLRAKDDELATYRAQVAASQSQFIAELRDQLRTEVRTAVLALVAESVGRRPPRKAPTRAR